ncbi:MAG: hypothetical protein QM638_11050 [Nocardioides sp.]|uniref:hypothetical protein n=1 Tax=Nocardioides sp. TaxID=35761 RepID=UPI0039E30E2A
MTGCDWDLRGARLAGFQFTEWLVINDGRDENFVDQYEKDPAQAWAAAQANGWVETVQPRATDGCRPGFRARMREPWPRVTGKGHLEVDRVRSLRNNPQARAQASRDALVLWLTHEGRGAGSAELMATRDDWRFFDTPFTVDEVNNAARFLRETGLVAGWDYPGGTFMQPVLAADGIQCVEYSDASVRDFLNPNKNGGRSVTYNQNFNGPFTGQAGQGEAVNQTQNQGIDAEALSAIFAAMRDALSTVQDPQDREDVEHGIQQLEAAVLSGDAEEITSSAGRLRRLGARVGTTASNAVIAAATGEGVQQLLGVLGLG